MLAKTAGQCTMVTPVAVLLCLVAILAVGARAGCGGPYVELSSTLDSADNQALFIGTLASFGAVDLSLDGVQLIAADPANGCSTLKGLPAGSVALVQRGNCSFVDKALAVQQAGASAMLMWDNEPGCIRMGSDPANTTAQAITIPCVSLSNSTGHKLLSALSNSPSKPIIISLDLIHMSPIDGSSWLLFIIAVSTCVGGSLWAGADHLASLPRPGTGRRVDPATHIQPAEQVDITMKQAVGFVFIASCMLLLLFFLLNKWFFYFLLSMFCLAATNGLTVVLAAISSLLLPGYTDKSVDVPCVGPCPVLMTGAFPVAACVAVVWGVFRNSSWAWGLQDLLGVALMLMVLRSLRLSSMRVACVLLPLCFFYDVFWVFISPYLFGGTSVMVEVAKGGSAKETMPMLLKVPRFDHPELGGYSMLGFGDIILPGLLVAYTRRLDIDMKTKWHQGYFLSCSVGYAGGLLLTYMALLYSWFGDQGQPALLYLVPCTLGSVLLLGAWRGHLPLLFAVPKRASSDEEEPTDSDGEGGVDSGRPPVHRTLMSLGGEGVRSRAGSQDGDPDDLEAGPHGSGADSGSSERTALLGGSQPGARGGTRKSGAARSSART